MVSTAPNQLVQYLQHVVPAHPDIQANYSNVHWIGGGAFSAVFRARRNKCGREAALKFLTAQSSPYRAAGFQREGQLLSTTLDAERLFVRLMDPPAELTVTATTVGVPVPFVFTLPYLSLEWRKYGDARNLIGPTHGYSDLLRRLHVFKWMCKSVTRMHNLGCIHRDLKPDNFFIGAGDTARLGDFGTARWTGPQAPPPLLTSYSGPVGDLRYSAPEALAAVSFTDEVYRLGDHYSLGAVFFELITGHTLMAHVFPGVNGARQFAQIFKALPHASRLALFLNYSKGRGHAIPDVRTINSHVPKCVAAHIMKILVQLSHYDYRQRAADLSGVQQLLLAARMILQHEARARRKTIAVRDVYV
jgi:serine/threonine protein kinase